MTEEQFLESVSELDKKDGGQQDSISEEKEEVKSEGQQEQQEAQDDFDLDSLTEIQREAYEMGWRPKDQFKGDPENWTSANAYIQYQTLVKTVAQQKVDFEKQLKENNQFNKNLYKTQIDLLKKQLEEKRDLAVEEGDLEGFKENQKQLDDLIQQQNQYTQSQPKQNSVSDPDLDAWISRNPWVAQDTPKSRAADAMFEMIKAENPTASTKEHLELLDEKLGLSPKKPELNPRRTAPSFSETGSRKVKAASRDLSMSDLTQEERDAWRLMGKSIYGGDEKRFLKAVKNSRV